MPHFKFLGQVGEYLVTANGYGVPGRDLSQADVDALDPESRAALEQHLANSRNPLYERHEEDLPAPEPAPPAADAAIAPISPADVPTNVALTLPPEPEPNQSLDAPA